MIILTLIILGTLLWAGLKITGVLLSAIVWVFINLPVALVLWGLALACCCTVILIPIGIKLFGAGAKVLL